MGSVCGEEGASGLERSVLRRNGSEKSWLGLKGLWSWLGGVWLKVEVSRAWVVKVSNLLSLLLKSGADEVLTIDLMACVSSSPSSYWSNSSMVARVTGVVSFFMDETRSVVFLSTSLSSLSISLLLFRAALTFLTSD